MSEMPIQKDELLDRANEIRDYLKGNTDYPMAIYDGGFIKRLSILLACLEYMTNQKGITDD